MSNPWGLETLNVWANEMDLEINIHSTIKIMEIIFDTVPSFIFNKII